MCLQPACWWTLRLGILLGQEPRLLRSPWLARAPLGLTVNELPPGLHRRGFWNYTLMLLIWTPQLCQSALKVTCSFSTSLFSSTDFPSVEESEGTRAVPGKPLRCCSGRMPLAQASSDPVGFLHHAQRTPGRSGLDTLGTSVH